MASSYYVPTETITITSVSTAGTTTTTASVTPANYDLYIMVASVGSGAAFTDTATISGAAGTWTKIAGKVVNNSYMVLWVGYGTMTAGTIAMTFSRTPTSGKYILYCIPFGQDGTNNPVGVSGSTSGTGTSGSISWSPSATAQALASYGFWVHRQPEATTPDSTGSTWTEDHDDFSASDGFEQQRLSTAVDATHTASWTTNVDYAGWALQMAYNSFAGIKNSTTIKKASKTAYIKDYDDEGPSSGGPLGVWAIVG